jgi:periplasmic divalent cation tolerance protein
MALQISLLYTTFPHKEEATKVTQELLEKHLIACANILGPIQSLYFWKDKLEKSQEVAVLFKTIAAKTQEVIDRIQELHSYDTPAILEIPVGKAALSFCEWIHQEVR